MAGGDSLLDCQLLPPRQFPQLDQLLQELPSFESIGGNLSRRSSIDSSSSWGIGGWVSSHGDGDGEHLDCSFVYALLERSGSGHAGAQGSKGQDGGGLHLDCGLG